MLAKEYPPPIGSCYGPLEPLQTPTKLLSGPHLKG